MARYRLARDFSDSFGTRWGIEEVVPGEKPVQMDFVGTRAQAEAEVHRLNLFGLTPATVVIKSKKRERRPTMTKEQRSEAARRAQQRRFDGASQNAAES